MQGPNRQARAIAALLLALLIVVLLAACGGGDDDSDPHVCYVAGKPMPVEACR